MFVQHTCDVLRSPKFTFQRKSLFRYPAPSLIMVVLFCALVLFLRQRT